MGLPAPLEVKGSWVLKTSPHGLGLNRPLEISLDRLIPWQEIRELESFAGTLQYDLDFDVPGRFLTESDRVDIELGDVWTQAEVFVNGMSAGVAWHSPFRVDTTRLLREGTNHVRVDVTNMLKNYKSPYLEEGAAQPRVKHRMGLLGPIRLVPTKILLIAPLKEATGQHGQPTVP